MGVGLPHVGFKQCQLMLGAVEGFSHVGTPATTFDSSLVGLAHFTRTLQSFRRSRFGLLPLGKASKET